MLENGADIRYIQAILGHHDLETTAIYTHVSIHKLKAVHATTHPAKLHRVAPQSEWSDTEAQALLSSLAAEEAAEQHDSEAVRTRAVGGKGPPSPWKGASGGHQNITQENYAQHRYRGAVRLRAA